MLEVKIDHKLNFEEHVETACVKDNKRLTALARATLSTLKKRTDNSIHNSSIVHLYDCSIAVAIIVLQVTFIRNIINNLDCLATGRLFMRNYLIKMAQLLYMAGIYRVL